MPSVHALPEPTMLPHSEGAMPDALLSRCSGGSEDEEATRAAVEYWLFGIRPKPRMKMGTMLPFPWLMPSPFTRA